jgi:hypothetical protein
MCLVQYLAITGNDFCRLHPNIFVKGFGDHFVFVTDHNAGLAQAQM